MIAPSDITRLLEEWRSGEAGALDRLIPVVYDELRTMAVQYLRREPAASVRPTELVHEVFIRLAGHRQPDFHNRSHFFGAGARIMRRILVDLSRRRNASKRSVTLVSVHLAEHEHPAPERHIDFVRLDEALNALEALDPLQARLVEIRFFGGLTLEETAAALDISPAKAKREWQSAKAWLLRRLTAV